MPPRATEGVSQKGLPMPITIRPAVPADYPAVARLTMQLHAEHAAARPDRFRCEGPTHTKKEFVKTLRDAKLT